MARIIFTTGIIQPLDDTSLQGLQAAVGGYIEVVRIGDGKLLVVDEDGLFKDLPVNSTASELAGQRVVGDVVLADEGEIK